MIAIRKTCNHDLTGKNETLFSVPAAQKRFLLWNREKAAPIRHSWRKRKNHCTVAIPIPQNIKMDNELCCYPGDDWKMIPSYNQMTQTAVTASDCMDCHSCETYRPQRLCISDHMGQGREE